MLLVIALIAAFIGIIALMANVTAWAYNIVVYDLFNGPGPIDGWVGLAINFLIGLIFGRNSVEVVRERGK